MGLWCRECILLEVYTTVGELAEGSLLLDLGGLSGVLEGEACQYNEFFDVAGVACDRLSSLHSHIRRQP